MGDYTQALKEQDCQLESMRTLYFHTGVHKTGSTALQEYLAANRHVLAQCDVSYEFPEGADQTMGNGRHLFEQIYGQRVLDTRVDELLEVYLAGRSAAICSSEDFTGFQRPEWQAIKAASERLGVAVKFVLYVRDLAPYYHSLHGQLIKGGEICAPFEGFCGHNQYAPVLDSLRCLLDLFGRDAITAIHYESEKDALDRPFLEATGLSAIQFDNRSLERVANRSLTRYEQGIVSRIHESSGGPYAAELSVFLLAQRPDLQDEQKFEPEILEILSQRHADDVEWLNNTFFGGSVVSVLRESKGGDAQGQLGDEERQAIDRDVMNWCLSKFRRLFDDTIALVANRIAAIDREASGNAAIPEDFDPVGYLLCNADILKASFDPHAHYIAWGKQEGRTWKWMKR